MAQPPYANGLHGVFETGKVQSKATGTTERNWEVSRSAVRAGPEQVHRTTDGPDPRWRCAGIDAYRLQDASTGEPDCVTRLALWGEIPMGAQGSGSRKIVLLKCERRS
jgi:hypothetical protein